MHRYPPAPRLRACARLDGREQAGPSEAQCQPGRGLTAAGLAAGSLLSPLSPPALRAGLSALTLPSHAARSQDGAQIGRAHV